MKEDARAAIRIRQLTRDNEELQKLLDSLPEGELHVNRNGNYVRYYQYLGTDDHGSPVRKYISKKERSLAIRLWAKGYISRIVRENQAIVDLDSDYISHQIQRKSFRQFAGPMAEDLAADGLAYIESVLEDMSILPDSDQTSWQRAEYAKNPNFPEHLKVHGVGNLMVRSKSESSISYALAACNVPFRYECKFHNYDIYPDFTIRRPLDGRIFLWEHFGLWDNTEYRRKAYNKLEIYAENGFIPGKNLIMTFETAEKPFVYDDGIEMIERYLV